MRTIEISTEVWQAIADRGKFGESEDDVLRRVFRLPSRNEGTPLRAEIGQHQPVRLSSNVPLRVRAVNRMSSYIGNGQLHVSFDDGASRSWALPAKKDKIAIRSLRADAATFAKAHDASTGQINAIYKTLTDNGYHLIK